MMNSLLERFPISDTSNASIGIPSSTKQINKRVVLLNGKLPFTYCKAQS